MAGYDLNDTIAAIATPIGESGIGIVRISGKEALAVAERIFAAKDGSKPSHFKTYTAHYGWIINREPKTENRKPIVKNDIVDEVILTVMRSPRSYTKEDTVEINCHGGIVALRRVLELVLENGCRLSEPGEFTRRAFLNGRIDLAQAEAVLDIIRAKTGSALKIGMEQLRGGLSGRINKIRNGLLAILSIIEAGIDFPEEEPGSVNLAKIAKRLNEAHTRLKNILSGAKTGRALREGITVVISGRTNVGKSSLLNALLRQERSIVTPIPGTTRDTIEETADIKGIPARIIDTAGIIAPRDIIERKAIQRAKRYMESADLSILLFDGSSELTREDKALIGRLKNRCVLAAINKIDLKQKIERDDIVRRFGYAVDISAKENKNIGALEDAIAKFVYDGRAMSPEPALISNLRHIGKLKEAEKLIAEALDSLDNGLSLEFVSLGLRDALLCLDDILGERPCDDLLDKIFSEFCIGK